MLILSAARRCLGWGGGREGKQCRAPSSWLCNPLSQASDTQPQRHAVRANSLVASIGWVQSASHSSLFLSLSCLLACSSCLFAFQSPTLSVFLLGAMLVALLPSLAVASGSMQAWTNAACSGTPALSQAFTVGSCFNNNAGSSGKVKWHAAQK